MVAQRRPPLAAAPGGSASPSTRDLGRSRSPSNIPPRGRWATNSPPVAGRSRARPTGPASDPGPGSEADQSAPPTLLRLRAKPTAKPSAAGGTTARPTPPTRDWGGELAQIRGRILAGDLRLSDIEKQLVEIQKLAKKLDEFAGQLVKHQQSVDERVSHQEGVNDCLRSAAQQHEAKLAAVEAAYAQHSARILELQQSTYSAAAAGSSAPTGATDPTSLAAVRDRLDQLSRNALEYNEKFKEVYEKFRDTDDKFITFNFTMQSTQADGFSESHRQWISSALSSTSDSQTLNSASPQAPANAQRSVRGPKLGRATNHHGPTTVRPVPATPRRDRLQNTRELPQNTRTPTEAKTRGAKLAPKVVAATTDTDTAAVEEAAAAPPEDQVAATTVNPSSSTSRASARTGLTPTTSHLQSSVSRPSKRRRQTKNYSGSTAGPAARCGGRKSGCTSTAKNPTGWAFCAGQNNRRSL